MAFQSLNIIGRKQFKDELKFAKKKLIAQPVEVKDVTGVISDERVNIIVYLSNGDTFSSDYQSVKINRPGGFPVTVEMANFWGSTGSVLGDCLLAYCENTGLKMK